MMRTAAHIAEVSSQHFPSPQPASAAQRVALIVEDNPVNQVLAEEMMKLLGFEVELANDGIEALEACQRRAPDVVLMDVQMPRMDGYDATRQLRRMQQAGLLRHFPIVAVTACGASRQQCLDAGMDGYIAKPLVLANIRRQLQDVEH